MLSILHMGHSPRSHPLAHKDGMWDRAAIISCPRIAKQMVSVEVTSNNSVVSGPSVDPYGPKQLFQCGL